MINRKARTGVWAAVILAASASQWAWACSVPVFRYALERWPADVYPITILHWGPLSNTDKSIVEALKKASATVANIDIETFDADPLQGFLGYYGASTKTGDSILIAHYPAKKEIPTPAWRGSLTADNARQLIDSPARRELARRLLAGQTAVWIILESGDAAADRKAAAMLQETLAALEKELKLPDPDPNDPKMHADIPLAIKFSTLNVPRGDRAESALVEMLLAADPRLKSVRGPIVYPVFGRARMLAALGESRLEPDAIRNMASFLTGPCQCEVKDQNPGIDMLVAADWDALIQGRIVKDPELPDLTSLSQVAREMAPTAAPATAPSATPLAGAWPTSQSLATTNIDQHGSSLKRNLLIVGGLGALVLVIGTIAMGRKGRARQ